MTFQRYKINGRVITDLKKRSTIGLAFYITLVFLIVFTDGYYYRNREFANLFICCVTGICVFRCLHLAGNRWILEKCRSASDKIFIASVIMTAVIWGLGFLKIAMQPIENNVLQLMIICTVGLCSGGAIAFMPDFKLSVIFNFFMLMPTSLVLMGSAMNITLGFCIFLFSVYLMLIIQRGNKEYWDALENEFLLEQKSMEFETISQIDVLTGIYNRRFFDDVFTYEFQRAMRTKDTIIILICDIDHFKQVNDQHGHLAGDKCLKQVADTLLKVFNRETDIVARYGGEEFVILMADDNIANALALAEKFRLMVQKCRFEYAGHKFQKTISIGIADLVPAPGTEKEVLISKADTALYKAKNQGRNLTVYMDKPIKNPLTPMHRCKLTTTGLKDKKPKSLARFPAKVSL